MNERFTPQRPEVVTIWQQKKRLGQEAIYRLGECREISICLHHNVAGPATIDTACQHDLDACVRRTAYWYDPDLN